MFVFILYVTKYSYNNCLRHKATCYPILWYKNEYDKIEKSYNRQDMDVLNPWKGNRRFEFAENLKASERSLWALYMRVVIGSLQVDSVAQWIASLSIQMQTTLNLYDSAYIETTQHRPNE